MKRLAIVLAVLTMACGYQNPDEGFQVMPGFSANERAEMQAACDEICDRTDGKYCPILLDDEWINTIRKSSSIKENGVDVLGRADIHRSRFSAHIEILMLDSMPSNEFGKVFRHELGHAGGCRHDMLNVGNLESHGTGNQPDTWTETDLECIDGNYDNSQSRFDE